MTSFTRALKNGLVLLVLWGLPDESLASMINMRTNVIDASVRIQQIHQMVMWCCIGVGILVFGAMFYAIFAHRRSQNPVPAEFSDSMLVEFIWTLIPVLIIVAMAIPTTTALSDIEDIEGSDITVIITDPQLLSTTGRYEKP